MWSGSDLVELRELGHVERLLYGRRIRAPPNETSRPQIASVGASTELQLVSNAVHHFLV